MLAGHVSFKSHIIQQSSKIFYTYILHEDKIKGFFCLGTLYVYLWKSSSSIYDLSSPLSYWANFKCSFIDPEKH